MVGIYAKVGPYEYDPANDDYVEIALCDACATKAYENGEAITYYYLDLDAICERCGKSN